MLACPRPAPLVLSLQRARGEGLDTLPVARAADFQGDLKKRF